MVKAHTPINWENEPSHNTPINETNLNKMDKTIGVLDDRIIEQETSKLDKSTAYTMVKDISFNENNGVFTVTRLNGSTFTIDTRLEKIAINFKYDYSTQKLIVTLIDGTTQSIDMSALVTQYEFADSATLDFTTDSNGKVTATIKSGSITEDMLQPNYLAEIKVETAKSAQSMANAKISENNAKQSELNAKASEEQALEYSNNAQPLAQSVSGNNPTATNSTDGSVIYLKNSGYTEQKTLSGKNLCDLSKATDGYMVAWESGHLYKSASHFVTDYIKVKPSTTYTIQGFLSGNENWYYDENKKPIKGISSATFTTPSNCGYIRLTGTLSTKGTQQVELGEMATDYEPFCGGTASPNPDYPQRIGANGDKGYFDGVLLQGAYKVSDGSYDSSYGNIVSSKNKIQCKGGDVIALTYGEVASVLNVLFYNEDGYISNVEKRNSDTNIVTAPSNATAFHIRVDSAQTITPSTAKHICVTINGMYALRVKTGNKNLFAFGNTAIDKTSELRLQTNQRLILSKVDKNTIKCNYNNGNYSVGYIVIEDIDGTKDYKVSYTIAENTTSYTPYMRKDNSKSDESKLVLEIQGNNKSDFVSNTNYFVLSNIQVELGTVATPFVEHQESEALIPVSSPLYEGDYIEVYADGTGREYRKMSSVVYDGSESGWTLGGSTSGLFYILKPTDAKPSPTSLLCSHYIKSASATGYTTDKTTNINAGNYWVIDNRFTSVDDFKAWLQSNPIHVLYEKAEPTSTPLTAEQVAAFLKLRTYKGVAHVTADGEVVMRYYVDNASGDSVSMLQNQLDLYRVLEVARNAWYAGGTIHYYGMGVDNLNVLYPPSIAYNNRAYLDVLTGYVYICHQTGQTTYGWVHEDDAVKAYKALYDIEVRLVALEDKLETIWNPGDNGSAGDASSGVDE